MPPSVLSRSIFRNITANKPIVHSGCLRQQHQAAATVTPNSLQGHRRRSQPRNAFPLLQRERRRTFFNLGLFNKAPRNAKDADLPPGVEAMMQFAKMERARARLPPIEDMVTALREFVKHKTGKEEAMEDTQAQLILQSMRYYWHKLRLGEASNDTILGQKFFRDLSRILIRTPRDRTGLAHVDLGRAMFEATDSRTTKNDTLAAYVRLLSCSGRLKEARRLVEAVLSNTSDGPAEHPDNKSNSRPAPEDALREDGSSLFHGLHARNNYFLGILLEGYAGVGDRNGVWALLKSMEQRGISLTQDHAGTLLLFHLESGDLESVKAAWKSYSLMVTEEQLSGAAKSPRLPELVHAMIKWCLTHDELAFGQQVIRDLTKHNPQKPIWDAIFVWAAGTNKGVDEINRMIAVMEQSNAQIENQQEWRLPDTTTINTLVKYAISRNDPYLAERFISLGRDRNIEPDARTYVLQMEYRLGVNDVDGALTAYKNLQSQDLSEQHDAPMVNRLIVALCKGKRHDFDTIMNVAADLSDRRAHFEPATVSALSTLHLKRNEMDDVADLLNTYVFRYSSVERAKIRDTIITFCVDDATPTAQSWATYGILRNIFDEMPREERTQLMTNFINRNRPDMAVHVFNHMRTHSRPDTIPSSDTYISAFMGIAQLRELESLEVIYNQLKLDYNIEVTTHLNNALIIAFSACGQARQALRFWDDIVASKEGPTYNSIHIALRACEKSPFGDVKAQEIWQRLRRTNVELDQSIWASYIAALAGNGDNKLAVKALEDAADTGEAEVDVFLCGSWFDACPTPIKQMEVEHWIKETHLDVWHRMEEVGFWIDEWGHRSIKIDRTVAL